LLHSPISVHRSGSGLRASFVTPNPKCTTQNRGQLCQYRTRFRKGRRLESANKVKRASSNANAGKAPGDQSRWRRALSGRESVGPLTQESAWHRALQYLPNSNCDLSQKRPSSHLNPLNPAGDAVVWGSGDLEMRAHYAPNLTAKIKPLTNPIQRPQRLLAHPLIETFGGLLPIRALFLGEVYTRRDISCIRRMKTGQARVGHGLCTELRRGISRHNQSYHDPAANTALPGQSKIHAARKTRTQRATGCMPVVHASGQGSRHPVAVHASRTVRSRTGLQEHVPGGASAC
jgi:hypothetical protein